MTTTYTKKEVLVFATDLNMPNRSKATKAEIEQWLADRGVDLTLSLEQKTVVYVDDEVLAFADEQLEETEEIEQLEEAGQLATIETIETEEIPTLEGELMDDEELENHLLELAFAPGQNEQLALPPAAEKAKKKREKKTPDIYVFTKMTEADFQWVEENTTVTMHSCSDPDRKVIKRSKVAAYLSTKLGTNISPKVMNQLVAMSCSFIERRALTIKSASRFNYLLNENQEAAMVMDYVLAHPEAVEIAREKYEIASRQGTQSIENYYQTM